MESFTLGLSVGTTFCGICGPDTRRDFIVMGAEVNMAARLCHKAEPGTILVSKKIHDRTQHAIKYNLISNMKVKGVEIGFNCFAPVRRVRRHSNESIALQQRRGEMHAMLENMVGRETEKALVDNALKSLDEDEFYTTVLLLEGEIGLGKTMLVNYIKAQAEEKQLTCLSSSTTSLDTTTPYFPLKAMLLRHVELDRTDRATDNNMDVNVSEGKVTEGSAASAVGDAKQTDIALTNAAAPVKAEDREAAPSPPATTVATAAQTEGSALAEVAEVPAAEGPGSVGNGGEAGIPTAGAEGGVVSEEAERKAREEEQAREEEPDELSPLSPAPDIVSSLAMTSEEEAVLNILLDITTDSKSTRHKNFGHHDSGDQSPRNTIKHHRTHSSMNINFKGPSVGEDEDEVVVGVAKTQECLAEVMFRVVSGRRRIVLIFDDVQWMDSSSVSLLMPLFMRLREQRCSFVAVLSARPPVANARSNLEILEQSVMDSDEASDGTNANLLQELVRRINLKELSKTETVKLLSIELKVPANDVNTKLVNEIYAKTNGSPLFMKTILTYLIDTKKLATNDAGQLELTCQPEEIALPESMKDSIIQRLDFMSQDCKYFLKVASLLGGKFETSVVGDVLATDAAKLEKIVKELQERGILKVEHAGNARYNQVCSWVQLYWLETVKDTVLSQQKATIHKTIAEHYESRIDNVPAPSVLAYHWSETEEVDKAVKYLELAGRKVEQMFALDDAHGHYLQALKMLLEAEETAFSTNTTGEQGDKVVRAPIRAALDFNERMIRGVGQQGGSLVPTNSTSGTKKRHSVGIERKLRRTGGGKVHAPPPASIVRIAVHLGNVLRKSAQYQEAIDYATLAVNVANESCERVSDVRLNALTSLGALYKESGNYKDCGKCYEEAVALSEELYPTPENMEHNDTEVVDDRISNRLLKRAEVNYQYGQLLRKQGRTSEAEELHQEALAIRMKFLASTDLKVAESQVAVALCIEARKTTEAFAEAIALHSSALKSREHALGHQSALVAESSMYVGIAIHSQQESKTVDELLHVTKPVLARKQSSFAAPSDDTRTPPSGESSAERGGDARSEAKPSSATANPVVTTEVPPSPLPESIRDVDTEGTLRVRMGKKRGKQSEGEYDEHEATRRDNISIAMHHIRRALVIREKVFGGEHPATAHALVSLANCQLEIGKMDAAALNMRRGMSICDNAFGPTHPNLRSNLVSFAKLLIARNQLKDALDALERARTIHTTCIGPAKHPLLDEISALTSKPVIPQTDLISEILATESKDGEADAHSLPSAATDVIVLTDPGRDLDDECALVVLAALSRSPGAVLRCRACIATLDPSVRRAVLARGTLDSLGLTDVPIGIGTDGGLAEGEDDFTPSSETYLPEKVKDLQSIDDLPPDCGIEEAQSLLLRVFNESAPKSLTWVIIASMKDVAIFVRANPELFIEKTSNVVIMGGVEGLDSNGEPIMGEDDDEEEDENTEGNSNGGGAAASALVDIAADAEPGFLVPDSAHNNAFSSESADYFYRFCQNNRIPMVVMGRWAAYACSVPRSTYEDMAKTRSPVARRLLVVQQQKIERLWQKAASPSGDPGRGDLPERCDKNWFCTTFLGGKGLNRTSKDAIWEFVQHFMMYDPMTMLAAIPNVREEFLSGTSRTILGTEHTVIGVDKHHPGIQKVEQVRAMLIRLLVDGLRKRPSKK